MKLKSKKQDKSTDQPIHQPCPKCTAAKSERNKLILDYIHCYYIIHWSCDERVFLMRVHKNVINIASKRIWNNQVSEWSWSVWTSWVDGWNKYLICNRCCSLSSLPSGCNSPRPDVYPVTETLSLLSANILLSRLQNTFNLQIEALQGKRTVFTVHLCIGEMARRVSSRVF